jgi:hypothetical protein
MNELSIADIKRMLQDRVESLASELMPEGRAKGTYWSGCSPLRAEKNPSFSIWLKGAGRGAFKDFGGDAKGDVIDLVALLACGGIFPPTREARIAAIQWGKKWLGLDGATPAEIRQRAAVARDNARARARQEQIVREERRRRAYDFWRAGARAGGSPVETYLKSRAIDVKGCALALEHTLRFSPSMRHPVEPHIGPAMLAKFCHADGAFAALHMTFLRPDGSGKADVGRPKIILGSYAGAMIRLGCGDSGLSTEEASRAGVAGDLLLGEGIENTLSGAVARPDLRAWAAGSLDNLGNVPKLPCISGVIVLKDNDIKPQAQAAFLRAYAKICGLGLPVAEAPALGAKDHNDCLRNVA